MMVKREFSFKLKVTEYGDSIKYANFRQFIDITIVLSNVPKHRKNI